MTLGDRVAVMRDGVIQQVDTPAELYERPANLFVAGFIGSPSMNFFPAHLEGDKLVTPLFDRSRRTTCAPRRSCRQAPRGGHPSRAHGGRVAGRRTPGQGATFRTKIDVLESVGSDIYAHFTIPTEGIDSEELRELAEDAGMDDVRREEGQDEAVARFSTASKARQGQDAEIWVDVGELHYFDVATGRAVGAPEMAVA